MRTLVTYLPASGLRTLLPPGILVAAAGVLSVVAIGAAKLGASDAAAAKISPTRNAAALSTLEPLRFRKIAPRGAVAINAEVPVSVLPNPAARPFVLATNNAADRERATMCLTSAIYYEAATESAEGQRAVAQVVLNRVRHSAYPNSVCGVVYQGMERKSGCQFTFTCDGSLGRVPMSSYWNGARKVAEAALSGSVYAPVGWATHYHTNWVVPYWSSSLVKAAVVGSHIFYRWTGGWGKGAAFGAPYAGAESDVKLLRSAAIGTAMAATHESGAPMFNAKQLSPLAATARNAPSSGVSLHRAALRGYDLGRAGGKANTSASRTGSSGVAAAPSRRWTLTRDAPLAKNHSPDRASSSD